MAVPMLHREYAGSVVPERNGVPAHLADDTTRLVLALGDLRHGRRAGGEFPRGRLLLVYWSPALLRDAAGATEHALFSAYGGDEWLWTYDDEVEEDILV